MFVFVRCVLAGAMFSCIVGLLFSADEAVGQTPLPSVEESIPRVSLEDALVKFQDAWSVDFSYNPVLLTNKWTHWVAPEKISPEDDLRLLLEGTGLSFRRLPSGTYAITRPASTSDALAGSLSGYVLDKMAGTLLARAHIRLDDAQRGTVTNTTGLFTFAALLPGTYTILVTHIGYAPREETIQIHPGQHTEVFVELQNIPTLLTPIIVDSPQGIDLPHPMSATLQDDALTQIKGLGTPDPVRSLNDLPGVRVGDAKTDVHIQGGDPGEHQFLLDGGLVFEPVHLFGLLGAFNPFALGRITVDKAGFSASKGSYLAGVINAEHALSDYDNYPLDVQIDPLSLNTRLNVHMGRSEGVQGDFMAALRTSVWDGYWSGLRAAQIDSLLLDWNAPDPFLLRASLFPLRAFNPIGYNFLVQQLDSIPPPGIPELGFNDVHLAGRMRFKGNTLHASYYRGGNRLQGRRLIAAFDSVTQELPNPDRYDWFNENAQARWSLLVAPNLFISTRLRSSRYRLDHEYSALDRKNARTIGGRLLINTTPTDDNNRIQEVALESTLDYDHRGGYLKAGIELIGSQHRFIISDVFTRTIDQDTSTWRMAFFAEEKLHLLPRLTLTGGVRLTYLDPQGTVYSEPRLELLLNALSTPIGVISIRSATGLYYQFLNQFDISTISPTTLFPSIRFWMPVDETIEPPKAYHAAFDLALQPVPGWTFRAEGYYKKQLRLLRIDYPSLWRLPDDEETEAIPITTQEGFLEETKGRAYGSAFMLERAGPTLRTSVRYEYNLAERDYAFRDSVRTKPVPWSEPHRLELALDWTPHPRFIATARWRGGWGRIWGFRRAYYDFLATDVAQGLTFDEIDFRNPESHTLDPFRQLDLGAAYTQPLGPVALQLRVDVLNATNRLNVADKSLLENELADDIQLIEQERYLLPRTLSMSVRLKW